MLKAISGEHLVLDLMTALQVLPAEMVLCLSSNDKILVVVIK